MYYISSGKVYRAKYFPKESTFAPYHVSQWIVYNKKPQQYKYEESLESHTAGNGSGNQCRSDDSKHHLKAYEYQSRDRLGILAQVIHTYSPQKCIGKISDNVAAISAETKGISNQDPQGG